VPNHPHLAFLACVALPFASELAAQDPGWATKVDELVAAHLADPLAVGFSVGVAQGGDLQLARGYGKAELEFEVAAGPATMFRIGSVTKQITAALIMRAEEAKKLTLEDGLERFVPGFPLQGHKVTIRHLLDHSSGIPSYTESGPTWQRVRPLELTHEELLALVAGKPFDFEPGTDWRYNNTGYYLLGMVLEVIHGKPYAQIVNDELALPLGLTRTRHDSNRDLIPQRAQGYGEADGKPCNDALLGMSQPGAAGALLSTGADLVRWSMALAGGKVVQPASYRRMTTPLVIGGRDTRYGFGLMTGEVAGLPCMLHGGGINGFNSVLLHVPQHDLHVAVISNSEHASSQQLAGEIVRVVLGMKQFVAKDLAIPSALQKRLIGSYRFEAIGMVMQITADGEKLIAKGEGDDQQAFRLLFQGGKEFRAEFDHEVKLLVDEAGKKVEMHQGLRVATGTRQ
jgi:D-alanyl-D-alanine carboxypeptidase